MSNSASPDRTENQELLATQTTGTLSTITDHLSKLIHSHINEAFADVQQSQKKYKIYFVICILSIETKTKLIGQLEKEGEKDLLLENESS